MFVTRFFLRVPISFLLLLLPYQTVRAQEPAKLISVINTGGSSKTLTIESRKYYYQQSIGQSAIIGLSAGSKYMVRQGFIQPLAGCEPFMPTGDLRAELYPNPFSGNITLTFPETITDPVYVSIFDLNGRIVYLKKFIPAPELNLDVSDLPCSVYILKVGTTTRYFHAKVIKLSF